MPVKWTVEDGKIINLFPAHCETFDLSLQDAPGKPSQKQPLCCLGSKSSFGQPIAPSLEHRDAAPTTLSPPAAISFHFNKQSILTWGGGMQACQLLIYSFAFS